MTDFVMTVAIIALVASWVVLFIGKTGIREYAIVHSPKFLSEMFGCDFCLSWWICFVLSVLSMVFTGNAVHLLCAFCAAPLARFITV